MSDDQQPEEQEQQEQEEQRVIQFPLPDSAAMVTGSVMALCYLDEEGAEKYAIYTSEGSLSTQLGMLSRAAHEINKAWDR